LVLSGDAANPAGKRTRKKWMTLTYLSGNMSQLYAVSSRLLSGSMIAKLAGATLVASIPVI
jgi:hypothetical protein